ncbi:hypothetical protein GCM10023063_04120 [Arthrobacter methylotrophus]|uniref:hypothetical protein n=1 Tax=Arthrobacter methylotrophus TaxID=121291 RepID=UPI0031ED2BD4
MHHYTSRAAAAIAAAVLLACTSTPAQGATIATTSTGSQQAVGSGKWGAVVTPDSAATYAPSPVPLKLTFRNYGHPSSPSFTPQFFTVGNTGNLPITAASYVTSTVAQASVRFIVESCSIGWDEPSGTCPGGTVEQVLATKFGPDSETTPGPAPATPGTGLRLRARVETNGNVTPNNYDPALTISTNVDRTQVRTATNNGS